MNCWACKDTWSDGCQATGRKCYRCGRQLLCQSTLPPGEERCLKHGGRLMTPEERKDGIRQARERTRLRIYGPRKKRVMEYMI